MNGLETDKEHLIFIIITFCLNDVCRVRCNESGDDFQYRKDKN